LKEIRNINVNGVARYSRLELRLVTRRSNYYSVEVVGEGDRFCYRINTDHKSNHIIFLFYRSGIFPTCHQAENECARKIRGIPYSSSSVEYILFPKEKFGPKKKKEKISDALASTAVDPSGKSAKVGNITSAVNTRDDDDINDDEEETKKTPAAKIAMEGKSLSLVLI
jgi:hypothetical protein